MPYLKPEDKPRLDPEIEALAAKILVGGELNYAITRLTILNVKKGGPISYAKLAERGWAHISAAAQEFYDNAMRRYENRKIAENGDVYDELFRD